jgi:hypothetical protein
LPSFPMTPLRLTAAMSASGGSGNGTSGAVITVT